MHTSSGDEYKEKGLSIYSALVDRHKAMNHRNYESSEFRLYSKISQQVTVPHKAFISSLQEGKIGEVWFGLNVVLLVLQGESEIVGVGVVESRCCQHSLYHCKIRLVVLNLGMKERYSQHRVYSVYCKILVITHTSTQAPFTK